MDLKHIKLTSGEDLLAGVELLSYNDVKYFRLHAPISLYIDPEFGYIAKDWLALSELTYADLQVSDITFVNPASQTAETYYYEYLKYKAGSRKEPANNESEDINALLEQSRNSIKH